MSFEGERRTPPLLRIRRLMTLVLVIVQGHEAGLSHHGSLACQ